MQKIALIAGAYNEARNMEKFLKHHSWVDEIIVNDSGSDDGTVELCEKYGRTVLHNKFTGSHNQRIAKAVKEANSDWIFIIDPDEFITDELKAEILDILKDGSAYSAYKNRRIEHFLDKPLLAKCWCVEGLKFFKKTDVNFEGDYYHEHPIVSGQIGHLDGTVLHFASDNIHWMISKYNYASEFECDQYYEKFGELSNFKFAKLLMFRPLKVFWKNMVKKKGYKEGINGLVFAVIAMVKDTLIICKYWEKYIAKNPNRLPDKEVPDPWKSRSCY